MGTRCLTVIQGSYHQSEPPKEYAVLYRQFDGYPDGHGAELKSFLAGKHVVNGISQRSPAVINGPGCCAAQIVAHFKKDAGGFYLYPAGTRDCGEEYVYTVTATPGAPIHLRVESHYGALQPLYDGPAEEFDPEAAMDEGDA